VNPVPDQQARVDWNSAETGLTGFFRMSRIYLGPPAILENPVNPV
jgi:hypothetical protein